MIGFNENRGKSVACAMQTLKRDQSWLARLCFGEITNFVIQCNSESRPRENREVGNGYLDRQVKQC